MKKVETPETSEKPKLTGPIEDLKKLNPDADIRTRSTAVGSLECLEIVSQVHPSTLVLPRGWHLETAVDIQRIRKDPTKKEEIIEFLRRENPVSIKVEYGVDGNSEYFRIESSIPASELMIPEGWYLDSEEKYEDLQNQEEQYEDLQNQAGAGTRVNLEDTNRGNYLISSHFYFSNRIYCIDGTPQEGSCRFQELRFVNERGEPWVATS